MKFQLYYTLNQNIRKKDLSKVEKQKLMSNISRFTLEETRAFFMLIHEHYVISGNEEKTMPYEGVQTKEGIEFNLSKLPIELRHILFKFSELVEKNK